MWLRLRQICLVARDLDPVVEDLKRVFGLEVCHVDEAVAQFGLVNALLPVGSQFLEVVAPTREGTAAGRYLDRRGGDGGYMVITQCDDHAPRRAQVERLGVRVAHRIDYGDFQGMQLHPRDTGGALFEIDHQAGGDAPDGPWHPAGPDWKPHVRTEVLSAIAAAELQSPDPTGLARRWGEIAGIPVTRDGADNPILELDNAVLRFVSATDGRGEGLGGLDLVAADTEAALARARDAGCPVAGRTMRIGGMRLNLI